MVTATKGRLRSINFSLVSTLLCYRKLNSKYSRTKNERQDDREINDVAEEEKDENLENETSTELKDKLKEERHKVEKLEEEVG